MAFPKHVIALLFLVLALANTDLSACQRVVKGKVSCLDCPQQYDLSGIKVMVKCDKVKKMAMATTKEDGVFQVDLPRDNSTAAPTSSLNKCDAKIFGGPNQIYATSKDMISELVKTRDSKSYTVSKPLAFSTNCCSPAKCGGPKNEFGSSKAVNLPGIPPEWGLAPISFYLPIFPIIGIP